MADLFPEEGSPARLKDSFREALSRATDSWMDHHNARIGAGRRGAGVDRAQFMEDIGKGWIVPEDFDPDAAEVGWGLAVRDPKYTKALGMFADEAELADPETSGSTRHGFRADRAGAGRYMGRGSLGTPVYVDPGRYGASFKRRTADGPYPGKMGVFAPEGVSLTTGGPSTGAMGHELGHAKQHIMEDPYVPEWDRDPGRKYFYEKSGWGTARSPVGAATEAVAGYLGRRIIRSKGGWGAAADDKSWTAYSGLPSYLRSLDDSQLKIFTGAVREYEDQYPGIYDETMRVIREYDTLVAPKLINDTSRGDWSEEGLKFMKEWRKKRGLKEVPEGSLQERANEMGPYSMRQGLRGDDVGRAVAGLGRGRGGVASPEMMSKMVAAS